MRPNTESDFWKKVDRKSVEQCWNWLGSKNKKGYGNYYSRVIVSGHMTYKSHRIAAWYYGLIDTPLGSQTKNATDHILHKCDNPSCCNPNHFLIGSHKNNAEDSKSKGRRFHPVGDKNGRAKLTQEIVNIIRQEKNVPHSVHAKIYGVSPATISKAKLGRTF